MHPELFHLPLPQFLQNLFGRPELMIHTYGFCIAMGIVAGYIYTARQAKKELGVSNDTLTNLLLYILLASVLGGKVFFYFEDPKHYFGHPSNLIRGFSSGFVFYGALLFAIPVMIWFFKRNKIPVLPMIDIMAITAPIVHAFGRFGCFNAGCCHGSPTESIFGVTYTNPHCAADPLNVPLHPTQLYEIFALLIIITVLVLVKRRKQFDGQVFLTYLFLYAIARSIIEVFRGDEARGYIIDHVISHSQFISILVLAGVAYFYFRLRKKAVRNNSRDKVQEYGDLPETGTQDPESLADKES